MANVELQARPRVVRGKKVKLLRAAGRIPANVFGPGLPSLAIELDARELRGAMVHIVSTTLVRLHVAGEDDARPVLLRGIERRPSTHEVLHLDFYQVPHGARVRLPVPLHYVGESPAARISEGAVVRHLDALEVEGVPGEVPAAIVVDLSRLANVDDVVAVRDLPVPANVAVVTPLDASVATVSPGRLHAAETATAAREET
ncbi:MAG: 50S ribosomal protein L25 [Chloroflexi bacterium]|nr:50S ribosomal protein L25 [Chloroflexota bacterium]